MRVLRAVAVLILSLVTLVSLAADFLAPYSYAEQHRNHPSEAPSSAFPLGTDELGRDRLSRLLYATRVSVILAPLTALATTVLASLVGLVAGYRGGWLDGALSIACDLFLCLPWLFLLLTLRALLPLDIGAATSLLATGALLACVGWADGARVVRASVVSLRDSAPVLHARAYGAAPLRILWRQILPNLRPVLVAQFWILVPVFILTEANLGLLGLSVTEPLPSLGNMLTELQAYDRVRDAPWLLAPALLVIAMVASLHFIIPTDPAKEH